MIKNIFLAFSLVSAQVNPDDFNELADAFCVDFYSTKGVTQNKIHTTYVANGAEAIVYRCYADSQPSGSWPIEAALKIYFDGGSKNFTDLAIIDEQLTDQGVRYPVYEWVEKEGFYAKFEEFLGEYKDFNKFPGGLMVDATRHEIIKQIAELHSADVTGINTNKHRDEKDTWWNTYLVTFHFQQMFSWLEDPQVFWDLLGWTEDEFWAEVDFTEKTLQGYYDKNPERAVICHNDIHAGNVMRNKDGEVDLEKIIIVDFDQAGYGFRMWDIIYFLSNIGGYPTEKIINDALQVYLDAQTYDENLDLATLQQEFKHHFPYFMLERMSFLSGMGFFDKDTIVYMQELYGASIAPFGRELPTNTNHNSAGTLFISALLLITQLL